MFKVKKCNLPIRTWSVGRIQVAIFDHDGKIRNVLVTTLKGVLEINISNICISYIKYPVL